MSLVRLPNGNWLDAWVIVGVRVQANKDRNGAAVVIEQLSGFQLFHNVDSFHEAEHVRDVLAATINAVRAAFPIETGHKP